MGSVSRVLDTFLFEFGTKAPGSAIGMIILGSREAGVQVAGIGPWTR